MCEIDIGNPKYNTLRLLSSGTKLFITFELKVFRREERERDTIFLCWLLLHRQLSNQPTRGARSAQSRLASPRSESQPSCSDTGTQLTAFSQIPKSSAHDSGHDIIHLPSLIFYLGFYFDICEWRILPARVWTPALMLYLTNPCTKRKVLILTKPKGKIYKTKFLRHYITLSFNSIICSC